MVGRERVFTRLGVQHRAATFQREASDSAHTVLAGLDADDGASDVDEDPGVLQLV
jgi:hypothetical protein